MAGDVDFRVGDVLSVTCPFTGARVTGFGPDHLALEWPWWQPDPSGEVGHWNGIVALGLVFGTHVWEETGLFRTDPAPEHLEPGDVCRVGVPPTVVHVTAVDRFDPPLKTVWLPHPRLVVSVLPRGLSHREVPVASHDDGTGYEIYPGDGIPFTFDLLFRPYASLQPGDEVADAVGRAWRFDGPWAWYAFDGEADPAAPQWPLSLLARAGVPRTPEAVATVARSTETGSHRNVLLRWTELTDAAPTPPARSSLPPGSPGTTGDYEWSPGRAR
ncbi:hypothetical protein [Streptomyces radiopugnans]|uniref:Uncharacterized protein n=1 Tax=Streptomyces radiopugnans TaxID=403935 RepID=A0A1H9BCT2_9ACTN|nr:hypothetical protein [Streptomyces radiopugnans]SEP86679.1 hypothetical protein SAMN05216481_102314 [Streptomyces radiopugnans]